MTDIPPRVRKKIIRDQMAWLRYYEHKQKKLLQQLKDVEISIESTKARIKEIGENGQANNG